MATIASDLIPKLSKLRRINFPSSLFTKDRALTEDVIQDFLNREESVAIGVYPNYVWDDNCPQELTEKHDNDNEYQFFSGF